MLAIILKKKNGEMSYELTMISAMTRGWRSGRSAKARPRVRTRTRQTCRMMSGSEKCSGLPPCHAPSDVAFIGAHSADDAASSPPPPLAILIAASLPIMVRARPAGSKLRPKAGRPAKILGE